jgi:hypothetical protein
LDAPPYSTASALVDANVNAFIIQFLAERFTASLPDEKKNAHTGAFVAYDRAAAHDAHTNGHTSVRRSDVRF